MIPKIIHYCWFGGKSLPPMAVRCRESWVRFFPDYTIKEWNETNFDVNEHPYTKYCYERGLWAYLSDYVRLAVVEREGGLYFDTDVEMVRRPDELLAECTAWFGWETDEYINTGLGFAAEAHHPAVRAMLVMYEGLVAGGVYQYDAMQGCPQLNTQALVSYGLERNGKRQEVCDSVVLPADYLCPFHDATGRMNRTDNTISIHWFSKSPHGRMAAWKVRLMRPVRRMWDVLKGKRGRRC